MNGKREERAEKNHRSHLRFPFMNLAILEGIPGTEGFWDLLTFIEI